MKKKLICGLSAFTIVFLIHAAYTIWDTERIASKWLQLDNANWFSRYIEQGNYMLGMSYGIAAAFTVYALLRFLELRSKAGASGVIGGITLTGVLYIGGCFLLGCCGSPMAAVYLSLFGSKALGFAKPFILILTLISVAIGLFWLEKKSKVSAKCCATDGSCEEIPGQIAPNDV